jgi:hypothetical protein
LKVKEKAIKIKEACEWKDKEVEERRQRVEKIMDILSDIRYANTEARDAAVLFFSKSAMTTEEIERIMVPGKPDYLAAQIYKKGVF